MDCTGWTYSSTEKFQPIEGNFGITSIFSQKNVAVLGPKDCACSAANLKRVNSSDEGMEYAPLQYPFPASLRSARPEYRQ